MMQKVNVARDFLLDHKRRWDHAKEVHNRSKEDCRAIWSRYGLSVKGPLFCNLYLLNSHTIPELLPTDIDGSGTGAGGIQ